MPKPRFNLKRTEEPEAKEKEMTSVFHIMTDIGERKLHLMLITSHPHIPYRIIVL